MKLSLCVCGCDDPMSCKTNQNHPFIFPKILKLLLTKSCQVIMKELQQHCKGYFYNSSGRDFTIISRCFLLLLSHHH